MITKQQLRDATAAYKTETRLAIETILDALNQGQRKKIVKDPAVARLCERYGVNTGA